MKNELTIKNATSLKEAGKIAERTASNYLLSEFKARRAPSTVEAYEGSVKNWCDFLHEIGITDHGNFWEDLHAWEGVSWGILEAFKAWMLQKGMSISTIELRISALRSLIRLAHKAGIIPVEDFAQLMQVKSFYGAEAVHVDERREVTRIGNKKPEPTPITPKQARRLKQQPNTPKGQRDRLMITLLLDQGLRISELHGLDVDSIDLETGLLTFYRKKVNKTQKHALSEDGLTAAEDYLSGNDIDSGPLIRRFGFDRVLTNIRLSQRGIRMNVKGLGKKIGLPDLTPHDCRHYWTTFWASKEGVNPFKLRAAGGWTSFKTVQRYVRDNEISNKGLITNER
jgi:integrase